MALPMTDEQYAKVQAWVGVKMARACPFCGGGPWTIADEIFLIPFIDPNAPGVVPDHGLAYVLLTCSNCAATAHLSVQEMGL
jgi:hypothetical protein